MKTKAARRENITGIPKLSIGTTKNDRGHVLKRYCFNFKDDNNRPSSKSFYFGQNKEQIDAFFDACEFMRESGENIGARKALRKIFNDNNHRGLI